MFSSTYFLSLLMFCFLLSMTRSAVFSNPSFHFPLSNSSYVYLSAFASSFLHRPSSLLHIHLPPTSPPTCHDCHFLSLTFPSSSNLPYSHLPLSFILYFHLLSPPPFSSLPSRPLTQPPPPRSLFSFLSYTLDRTSFLGSSFPSFNPSLPSLKFHLPSHSSLPFLLPPFLLALPKSPCPFQLSSLASSTPQL